MGQVDARHRPGRVRDRLVVLDAVAGARRPLALAALHVGVVLSLQRIGKLQDLGSGPLKFNLKTPADNIAPESLRVVVFAQSPGQGPVRGAASISTTKQ